MKLVRKIEFIAIAFDLKNEIFIVYVVFLISFNIHLFHKAQITLLKAGKSLIVILLKYVNFANIFSSELIAQLSEYIKINDYTINLIDSKKLPYRLIYSLEPIELKILKTYIEINLANNFIRPSKSYKNILIFFI